MDTLDLIDDRIDLILVLVTLSYQCLFFKCWQVAWGALIWWSAVHRVILYLVWAEVGLTLGSWFAVCILSWHDSIHSWVIHWGDIETRLRHLWRLLWWRLIKNFLVHLDLIRWLAWTTGALISLLQGYRLLWPVVILSAVQYNLWSLKRLHSRLIILIHT